jgi:hypothetical protein
MIRFSVHPPGKQFALTFVDDTDASTRENTEPVYDFLAHQGFWGTKTVWPLQARRNSAFRRDLEQQAATPSTGDTLEHPEYLDFIRKLQRAGFEIALHGVAAGNSTRHEILHGLCRYEAALGEAPSMMVFHQTNIDNLYCGRAKLDTAVFKTIERFSDRSEYEGHREGSRSFWGDVIKQKFRYVRLPFHTIDDVDTLALNPSMPFHDSRRPYVRRWFAASDGADLVRFNRLLSENNVMRLAQQRGGCIVYTHFAKGFARRRNGRRVLDSDFVRTVERVAKHPGAWFTTASGLLDRLAAIRSLRLAHHDDQIEIAHLGDIPLKNVAMHLPDGMTVDGDIVQQHGQVAVVSELQPGATMTMRSNRKGSQLIEPGPVEISRRERNRIEYRNYLGLVRGELKDRWLYRTAARA